MADSTPQHRYNLRNTPQWQTPQSSPATVGYEIDSDISQISYPDDNGLHSPVFSVDSDTSTVDYNNHSIRDTQPPSPVINTEPVTDEQQACYTNNNGLLNPSFGSDSDTSTVDNNHTVRAVSNFSFINSSPPTPAQRTGPPRYIRGPPQSTPKDTPATVPRANSKHYNGATRFLLDKLTSFAINQHNQSIDSRLNAQRTTNGTRQQEVLVNNTDPISVKASPDFFSGNSTESVNHFLRSFTKFANHMDWSQEKRLRSIPIFLTHSAALWYEDLTDAELPDTFDQFCQTFRHGYDTNAKKLRAQRVFHQIFQKTNESVNSFHQRLMLAADEFNISIEEKTKQFLGGLLTNMKTQVLSFKPETLTDALHKALYAEEINQSNRETKPVENNATTSNNTNNRIKHSSIASNISNPPRSSRPTPAKRPVQYSSNSLDEWNPQRWHLSTKTSLDSTFITKISLHRELYFDSA